MRFKKSGLETGGSTGQVYKPNLDKKSKKSPGSNSKRFNVGSQFPRILIEFGTFRAIRV